MTIDLTAIRARAEEAEALRAMMLKKDVRPECEGKSRCCGPWVLVEPAIILTVREQDEVMYSLGQANDDRAALLAEVERLTRNLEYASAECAEVSVYRQLVREEHPAEVAALTAEVERLRADNAKLEAHVASLVWHAERWLELRKVAVVTRNEDGELGLMAFLPEPNPRPLDIAVTAPEEVEAEVNLAFDLPRAALEATRG